MGQDEEKQGVRVQTFSLPVLVWFNESGFRLRFVVVVDRGGGGGGVGVTKFLLGLSCQSFVLLRVVPPCSLLHGLRMMEEFLWSGEKGYVR